MRQVDVERVHDLHRLLLLVEREEPGDDGDADEGDAEVEVVVRRVLVGQGSKGVRHQAEDGAEPEDQGRLL